MSCLDPAEVAVVVIAKQPLPGRCKTRLSPPLQPEQAAELAQASLADTLDAVRLGAPGRCVLALDGKADELAAREFELVRQPAGGLGARLAAALAAVGGPGIVLGMDTPQLGPDLIARAVAELCHDGVDAVLGPAIDGGYWTIGARRPVAALFDGVPMSSPSTAAAQRRRLGELGLRWSELPALRDFDTVDDAVAVAALCPGSRFADALAGLSWPAAP